MENHAPNTKSAKIHEYTRWEGADHLIPECIDGCLFLGWACVTHVKNVGPEVLLDVSFLMKYILGYPLDEHGNVCKRLYGYDLRGTYAPIDFKLEIIQNTNYVRRTPHRIVDISYVGEDIVKMTLILPNTNRDPRSKRPYLFDEHCETTEALFSNSSHNSKIRTWIDYVNTTYLKEHKLYIVFDAGPLVRMVRVSGESIMALWR